MWFNHIHLPSILFHWLSFFFVKLLVIKIHIGFICFEAELPQSVTNPGMDHAQAFWSKGLGPLISIMYIELLMQ